ncbi:MAG: hypothetical protein B7X10_03830 [Burkholderiales bacterium 21-58-4]|nr:MAG: hypothetical protein B7X10_03830 [Burkholderiales bacterium 21-58-4]
MVRYGGTNAAAVEPSVRRKPIRRAVRYGLAKRHRRSKAQVEGGACVCVATPGCSSCAMGVAAELPGVASRCRLNWAIKRSALF